MTPPLSLWERMLQAPVIRDARQRRIVLLLLVLLCAAFTLFPERYRAAVTLTPSDPAALGLGGALGQLGAINSVFGTQAAIEIGLKVARSMDVRKVVARRLKLGERLDMADPVAVDRWLTRKVTIRSLRGGIILIETSNLDAQLARDLVDAFAGATRQRLGEINRQQTEYKRDVLIKLVQEAGERRAAAQAAFDNFRLKTRFTQPNYAIEVSTARLESIRSTIKAKEVALNAARQFATDDNMTVRQILAELGALRSQLREAEAQNPQVSGSVGDVVGVSTRLVALERDLLIARGLYDGYTRYLEGTAVEDLTSTANVRVLEPPFIDSARQFNLIPLTLGLLIILFGIAVEFYYLRPPVRGLSEGS